jgi:hypothetical protein
MVKMNRIIAAAIALPFLSLTSCSLVSPTHQTINIIPSHERADVYVDGEFQGKGTQAIMLEKASAHGILVKCGGSSGVGTVRRKLSTTGILDIIGGALFLVPLFGLFAPGAWRLSPDNLVVVIPDESLCEHPPVPPAA